MKNNLIILLNFIMAAIYGSSVDIIERDFNFEQFCLNIQSEPCECNYKDLNAFDKSEKKYLYLKNKEELLNKLYLLKLSPADYTFDDYNYKNSEFVVKEIFFKDKNVKFQLKNELKIKVPQNLAKIIAAKKELEFMDIYVVVKFQTESEISNQFCNNNPNIVFYPEVYEYIIVCTQSGKVIFGDEIENISKNENFINSPLIEGLLEDETKDINSYLLNLNKEIEICLISKEYGVKLYELNINESGVVIKNISSNSTFSNTLEKCVDDIIVKRSYPKFDKKYTVYFSVVIPNIN